MLRISTSAKHSICHYLKTQIPEIVLAVATAGIEGSAGAVRAGIARSIKPKIGNECIIDITGISIFFFPIKKKKKFKFIFS